VNTSKRTDTCIERWWQGVGAGEVEPTTKMINATRTVWNFQKPVWNVGGFIWWLGGNSVMFAVLLVILAQRNCSVYCTQFCSVRDWI